MSTSPTKYKKPAAAPKAADVEKLGSTLRILILTRDKVVKDYEKAK